ncbi:MAG: hypothetical protein EKK53_21580 [Burkholderiales bacterium]|nr:MAG: hypothetical protein EKK53_21580 [Burkholderiales bacterium]
MNRFFAYLANLSAFQRARAGDVAANFTLLETGLDLTAAELDRSLKCQPTDPAIGALPLKDVRAGRALYFDAGGDPVARITATEQQMQDAITAANAAAASANEAATTAANLYGILPGVAGQNGKTLRITGGVYTTDSWWGAPTALTVASNGLVLTANTTYHVDSSGGAFAVTLPVMAAKDWIKLVDIKGLCSLNNVTVNGGGNGTFRDGDATLVLDVDYDSVELVRTATGVIEQ